MTRADSNRHERLAGILERETAKLGKGPARTPAVFRDTALDTHKTAPVELFGAAYQNAPMVSQKYGSSTMASGNVNTVRRQAIQKAKAAKEAGPQPSEPVEFKSVFKPRPEQEYVCSMARQHRDKVANSEWALLDTLEVQMHLDETEMRQRRVRAGQANQRAQLDHQMQEVGALRAQEEELKQLEKRTLESELERYKRDQALKEQTQRARNVSLRQERQDMLQTSRQLKANTIAKKKAEEAAELDAVMQQLEEEKRQAAAKLAAAKVAMAKAREENEQRVAARRANEARQKAEDEELMKQTIATLERQEKEREEKLKAFLAMVAARADKAGQQAVADNKERMEREARLIKQFEAQKEAEYEAKEAAMKRKKALQKQELIQASEDAAKAKAARTAAAKAAVEAERLYAEQLAEGEAAAQARKMQGIRNRALDTQDFVKTQMRDREQANVDDDTCMTARERELNTRLLNHATRIVGQPKQYSVRLN